MIGRHLLLSSVTTAVKPAYSVFDHRPNPIQEGDPSFVPVGSWSGQVVSGEMLLRIFTVSLMLFSRTVVKLV